MAKDVLITPASGLIQFKDTGGNVGATIQLDDLTGLNITGTVSIGDLAANVYIGDGVNSVDIIFEQNGAVRALTGKTLTLGEATSNLSFAANITSGANITGNVVSSGNITGGNLLTSGAISATGKITLGTTTYPNAYGTTGQFLTSYGNGQLYWSSSGGNVSGSLTIFLRSGTMTVGIISGYLTIGTRTGNISVPVT